MVLNMTVTLTNSQVIIKDPAMTHTPTTAVPLAEALKSARETRALVVAPGALAQVVEVFRTQFPGQRALVVADPRTFQVAGERVLKALADAGLAHTPPHLFTDPGLYAEIRFVEELGQALR